MPSSVEETAQADATPYLPTSTRSPVINSSPESTTRQQSSHAVSTQQTLPMQDGFKNLTINSISGAAYVGGNYNVQITAGPSSAGLKISQFNNKVIIPRNEEIVPNETFDAGPDCRETVKQDILDSKLPLSVDNMYLIAENISKEYRTMARFLPGGRLTTSQLETFEADNREFGQVEIIIKILERWSQKAPDKATVGQLALVLQKIGKVQLANRLSLENVVLDDENEVQDDE